MRWTIFPGLLIHLITGNLLAQKPGAETDEQDVILITHKLDSLPELLKNGKVTVYTSGCTYPEHQFQYAVGSGIVFSKQALNLSKDRRFPYILTYALNLKAGRLYENKNYEEANTIWGRALGITIKNGFSFEELHMCRQALNNTSFLSGNYAEAMKISSEGLHRAEMISDKTVMAHFSNVIGYIHMKQKNFPEANRYFTDYLNLTRELKDSLLEGHALYNLGDLYLSKGSYDSAMHFLQRSILIYRSASSSPIRRFDLDEREGYISNKMAQVRVLQGDFKNALRFINASLRSAKAVSGVNAYDKAEYYIRAAEIYNRLHQPDSALFFTGKGLTIARQIKHREHMMYGYEQRALAFAFRKQYDSAWYYQVMFQQLKDTITNESSQRDILLRETNLNIEREADKQQAALEKQRLWRNFFIGLAIFSMVITYLLYNRYRLRQKTRLQAELNKQQLEILRTTIEVQDKERRRIAEDLHDSLGSILSAAKLKLSAMEGQLTTGGHSSQNETMNDVLSLMDEAMNEMKNIAYNIMPATLSRLGLIAALQNLFNRISSQSLLKINFSTFGFDERPDQLFEVSIYRIVLESINNVVRHADARNVTVQLIRYPDYINITIEDDGKGFHQTTAVYGNGLTNIDSRVKNLGGTLNIDSSEGSGTTIFVDIPCQKSV